MTREALEQARYDLEWLRHVRAVRAFEEGPAGFVVELLSGRLLELDVAAVPVFRVGVLVGWRLPRVGGGS